MKNIKELLEAKKKEYEELREKMLRSRYGVYHDKETDDQRFNRIMNDPSCWEGMNESI